MTQEPTFHKILLAPDHFNPISAVVIDADGEKNYFKFRYTDEEADFDAPGELTPELSAREGSLDEETTTLISVATDGVNKHTTYDAIFNPDE